MNYYTTKNRFYDNIYQEEEEEQEEEDEEEEEEEEEEKEEKETQSINVSLFDVESVSDAKVHTITQEQVQSKAKTLATDIYKSRKNEFMEFLIILNDEHYKKKCLGLKPEVENIRAQHFPGEVLILHKNDLHKEEYGHIKIDETIRIKKLYIKVHKDNIYTDASNYQDRIVQSTLEEFMSVILSLNPKTVTLKMKNNEVNKFKTHITSSINVNNVNTEVGIGNEEHNSNEKDNNWNISLDNTGKVIDTDVFLDKNNFYYLPYYSKWIDLIKSRVLYEAKNSHYTYNFCNSDSISIDFVSKLHFLGIDFNYSKSKYESFSIEYNIEYYPLVKYYPLVNVQPKCIKNIPEKLQSEEDKKNKGSTKNNFNFFGLWK